MKPKKKKAKPSLLARLFGGKSKTKPATKGSAKDTKRAAKTQAPRKTPLDRSIAEIKTMVRIGENNPARLASILGNLIKAEQAKKAKADEDYQRLIQGILDREQKKQEEPPPDSAGP